MQNWEISEKSKHYFIMLYIDDEYMYDTHRHTHSTSPLEVVCVPTRCVAAHTLYNV